MSPVPRQGSRGYAALPAPGGPDSLRSPQAHHGEPRFRVDLDSIEHLPSLPEVVTRILSLVDDPVASAQQIGDVVGQDQSMVASILRLVNSPFYGLSRRITSIQHAIVLLGFRTIRNMALSAVLVKSFGESSRDRRFDRSLLWRHTIACAIGSRLLARKLRTVEPEEAFLAGLIHDMGLVVLDQYFHDGFRLVLDRVLGEGMTLVAAEREIFGQDHAETGAQLGRRWNFHPTIVEAIACHHDPARAKKDPILAGIVHVAGSFNEPRAPEMIGGGEETEQTAGLWVWETDHPDPAVLAALGITDALLTAARVELAAEWGRAQALLRTN